MAKEWRSLRLTPQSGRGSMQSGTCDPAQPSASHPEWARDRWWSRLSTNIWRTCGLDCEAAQQEGHVAALTAGFRHQPVLEGADALHHAHSEAADGGGGPAGKAVEAGEPVSG